MACCSSDLRSDAMHNSFSPKNGTANGVKAIRCGIYTRKSTEEGLDQEFNSLHLQREAGEVGRRFPITTMMAASAEGTSTGRRCSACLADIEARRVDCVVPCSSTLS